MHVHIRYERNRGSIVNGHRLCQQVQRPKYGTKAACDPYCPPCFPSELSQRSLRSLCFRPLGDYILRYGTWYTGSARRTQTAETPLIPLALNISHFGKSEKELVLGLAAVPRRPLAYAMLLRFRMNFSHPTYPDSRAAPSYAVLTISSRPLFSISCLASSSLFDPSVPV